MLVEAELLSKFPGAKGNDLLTSLMPTLTEDFWVRWQRWFFLLRYEVDCGCSRSDHTSYPPVPRSQISYHSTSMYLLARLEAQGLP